ncbi:MAG TPA: hypothetical protein PKG54_10775 [Phycisphaerae bacterium]|jgi:hypothetical protein|nr:hypothetical protein [Phycisphaerae bacterium]HOB74999.1 hypothetical protein [Phycisphaerae bacterium]HOJ55093.1 hypothetical protein [Phycisphaerae bacterium]HOL28419.1 hypothetical protein [Phycisphaerae bacterium]HPP21716.1 hypothetical protein [Phycisphaerae bacterium]
MRLSDDSLPRRGLRRAVLGLVLVAVLVGASGPGCDHEAAAAFREAATGPIGEGVRGIVNGVLDGVIAAIENAGDGGSESKAND